MDIAQILGFVSLGLVVGGVAGWLLARRSAAPDAVLLAEKAAAEALAIDLRARLAAAETAREAAEKARIAGEREAALGQQRLAEQEKRLADFQAVQAEMTKAAKLAAHESGEMIAKRLLETHQIQAEAQKKQGEEAVKQTTEALFQRFNEVAERVAQLGGGVERALLKADTVHRALSHPGGAGRLAEIGLENLLKSFGLEPGRDFIVQYHAAADQERGALRPDAVLFLPGDAALVIDSKASKTLLEHAEAEANPAEAEAALARFAQRMNQHLRSLGSKDYGNAVLATYKGLKRGGQLRRTVIAMALPNDAAVEKLRAADPEIQARAAQADIMIVGPSALEALVAFARTDIEAGRQAENLERIVEAVRNLMESLGTALGAAEKAGKGLQTAAEQFEAFTRSVNGRLLPRVRKLAQLGVRPAKAPPQALPSFEVSLRHPDDIIEAEAEEVPRLPFNSNEKPNGNDKP